MNLVNSLSKVHDHYVAFAANFLGCFFQHIQVILWVSSVFMQRFLVVFLTSICGTIQKLCLCPAGVSKEWPLEWIWSCQGLFLVRDVPENRYVLCSVL